MQEIIDCFLSNNLPVYASGTSGDWLFVFVKIKDNLKGIPKEKLLAVVNFDSFYDLEVTATGLVCFGYKLK